MKLDVSTFCRKINLDDTYSQAGQDLFVTRMLNNKVGGFFIKLRKRF
jgi:hypothetical protein